jgi:hypothetical protein
LLAASKAFAALKAAAANQEPLVHQQEVRRQKYRFPGTAVLNFAVTPNHSKALPPWQCKDGGAPKINTRLPHIVGVKDD